LILEHNDGVVLQIIYEGDLNADMHLQGLIEGQPRLSRADYSFIHKLAGDDSKIDDSRVEALLFSISLALPGFAFGVAGVLLYQKKIILEIKFLKTLKPSEQPPPHTVAWAFSLLLFVGAAYMLYIALFVQPPLSFSP
jgi:hypothetical protein